MIALFKNYFNKKYLPRWIVFLFDLVIVFFTYVLAYILRFNFDFELVLKTIDINLLFWVLPIYVFCFLMVKPHSGIIRHSTTKDITRIIFSLSLGSFILAFISYVTRNYNPTVINFIPYSVILIQFSIASLILVTSRLLTKGIYFQWFFSTKNVKNTMIFGAGSMGQITRNVLSMDGSNQTKLIGFIDDNPSLQNKSAAGIPIYSAKVAFDKIIERNRIDEIILAIEKKNLPIRRKREIVDLCIAKKITIKEIPTVNKWLNGQLTVGTIKKVQIEDLLGRDTISLDRQKIMEGVKKGVVLITGAAGSIGSEIVRQLMLFQANHVVLLDKAESDIYNLQIEIQTKYKGVRFTTIVGDVCNNIKLRKIFECYSPTVVINAAAYKHVPLMEEYPCEAIRVNIGGTKILADLSLEFGVEKFVLVSTDKAVNPTNVMGATKRISEIYIQSLLQQDTGTTQFITTRFGNVLGSNGSVVPLFKKQIANGGPVTVTHKEITRYFMTIPEACQLVLEACFMGKGGEIFVFDMGDPVKIYSLAEKMIFLSGFVPHKDIKIEITDLRPGEKLYEELLNDKENTLPTYNNKIMIGKVLEHDYEMVNYQIEHLLQNIDNSEKQTLIDYMRKIVPEFISNNSYSNNIAVKI